MNFEVDRHSSAWAHIALCADPTWASETPDAFILANQRLWAQHCKISQVLRESSSTLLHNQCERTDKQLYPNAENGNIAGKSVKDTIPESRLAQYYGHFFYDEAREKCYSNASNKQTERCNGYGCESSDETECWMLPEVEYWFRKLMDDSNERNVPRRRRQFKIMMEDDFERWVPSGEKATEENTLEARIQGVRALWQQNFPQTTNKTYDFKPRKQSPPASRKIRARRRQPRRLASLASPPPAHCMGLSNQLLCDHFNKFDVSRQPPLRDFRRAMGRLTTNHQSTTRGTTSRCPLYRGTQVSRYTPTSQRPVRSSDKRCGIWWQRSNLASAEDEKNQPNINLQEHNETTTINNTSVQLNEKDGNNLTETNYDHLDCQNATEPDKVTLESEEPSTSASKIDIERKKRLYSTVLSMSPPSPVNMNTAKLSQKFTPGLIKLNPKIVFSSRPRPSNISKFEELEKQALEQYKPSDESIDTKFRELERQAVEQYSTSNSNTSCSSENSTNTKVSQETQTKNQSTKFHKGKPVDSVVIYSQNFPDLNSRGRTKSIANLKNFHTPPRGEKKEQNRRMNKTARNNKNESQRAASDTDYDGQDCAKGVHKNTVRWTIHGIHPKKRHLSLSVSDLSSDDESVCGPIKGARLSNKYHVIKAKMFAHGAGDLQTIKKIT